MKTTTTIITLTLICAASLLAQSATEVTVYATPPPTPTPHASSAPIVEITVNPTPTPTPTATPPLPPAQPLFSWMTVESTIPGVPAGANPATTILRSRGVEPFVIRQGPDFVIVWGWRSATP